MPDTKIAILMTVHKNQEQVNRLIKHLAADFDVYVHVDQRSRIEITPLENVHVFKKFKVYWGSFNQIMATLLLFEQAFLGAYDRYLLISGQDIPLKSNAEIKSFFEGNTKEYLRIDKMPVAGLRQNGGLDRLTRYYVNHHQSTNKALNLIYTFWRLAANSIGKLKPRPLDYEFYKGTNWINLTHKCLAQILDYLKSNPQYINRFKYTNCADEIFYHTLLMMFEGIEIENENLRFVNWTDGPEFPRILRMPDLDQIGQSDKLFARKFDPKVDPKIIDILYQEL